MEFAGSLMVPAEKVSADAGWEAKAKNSVAAIIANVALDSRVFESLLSMLTPFLVISFDWVDTKLTNGTYLLAGIGGTPRNNKVRSGVDSLFTEFAASELDFSNDQRRIFSPRSKPIFQINRLQLMLGLMLNRVFLTQPCTSTPPS